MITKSQETAPGQVFAITAVSNPRVKYMKSLSMKKVRDSDQVFLVEGAKLVRDAGEKDWQVCTIAYDPAGSGELLPDDLVARSRVRGAQILEVNRKVLGAISRKDNPQTVLAVVRQKWCSLSLANENPDGLWLVLDRVRDPGNLGTIIRTADAAGASGIILVGDCTDPYSIEATRASMGSIFNVPLVKAGEAEFLSWHSSWKGQTVGTHLDGAVDYRKLAMGKENFLLLMGNEQQGLPDSLAKCCDSLVRIPMAGSADSLNLAVATGIMLFKMIGEREESGDPLP